VTADESARLQEDRIDLAGKVDFTIMYAAHDAFTRDLRLLGNVCGTWLAWMPGTAATWSRSRPSCISTVAAATPTLMVVRVCRESCFGAQPVLADRSKASRQVES
jgi:hypothetical protein